MTWTFFKNKNVFPPFAGLVLNTMTKVAAAVVIHSTKTATVGYLDKGPDVRAFKLLLFL